MQRRGPAFALRALLRFGRAAFALLRSFLVFLCGGGMFRVLFRGRGLMLICEGPEFGRPLPLLLGTLLTRPAPFVSGGRELRGTFAVTGGYLLLLTRPESVRLCFLAMSGCLAAKALALAATVLGRPASDQQPDTEQDEDGDDNRYYGNCGHVLFLPVRILRNARPTPPVGPL